LARVGTFESWKAVEDKLNADYERLKQENPEQAGNLENERKRALTGLRGLKDPPIAPDRPGSDRDRWIKWLQREMREFNFIRFGATMQVSAIPDLGAAALHHLVIPMIARYGKDAFQPMKTFEADTDFKRLLNTSELAMHGSMLSSRVNDQDLIRRYGIGTPGSRVHSITSQIDRVGLALSDFIGKASGLGLWDRWLKIMAGMQGAREIAERVARYEKLTGLQRDHARLSGDRAAQGRAPQPLFQQHAEVD